MKGSDAGLEGGATLRTVTGDGVSGQIYRAVTESPHAMKLNAMLTKNQIILWHE